MSNWANQFDPPFEERRDNIIPRRTPPFRVVLPNNGTHGLMKVVHAVMEVTRLCRAEATHKMWEAHHTGRSELLVTHQERAELYVEQFADHGLTVVIEPVR